MDFAATPTLAHERVVLEPLSLARNDDLADAVAIEDLWRTWYTRIPSPSGMWAAISERLERQRAGAMAPWAIVDPATGRAVGVTSYWDVDPANRRVEIGGTWLSRPAQGTGINSAAKLLLLTRAFEELGCIAVEFRTHWHNHQSRRAIENLGAKQDGVLRKHVIFDNGTVRDTVVFSITDDEWPTVKFGLEARLAR
ncbi:GNAT family protein [Microbacterium sp. X-17]|uniref:GNAT family N-acetyltransferase n=1 Tax=Microbacterium sp. X-17 TaxID=3144404 RepID=UPI0031F5AE52